MSARPATGGAALVVLQRAAALVAIAIVVTVLVLADRGFDITDEGYYLNWISTPYLWNRSPTQFGFVYHPIWLLVDGDIAWLRRVTILLSVGLAAWVGYLAPGPAARSWRRLSRFSVAMAVAVAALLINNQWLLTPNYNTLTFQGTMMLAAGLLLWWSADGGREDLLAGATLGMGGATVFLAKPTAAGAMAALVVVAIVIGRQARPAPLLAAGLATLAVLGVASIVIDGSLAGFIGRERLGAQDAQRLDPRYRWLNLFHRDSVGLRPDIMSAAVFAFVAVVAITIVVAISQARLVVVLLGAASAAAVATLLVARPGLGDTRLPAEILLPLALPAAAVASRALLRRHAEETDGWLRSASLVSALWLLPFAAALGTGNNKWVTAGHFAVLWVAAAVTILRPLLRACGEQVLTATVTAAVIITGVSTTHAMRVPYRQPEPVWDQRSALVVGAHAHLTASTGTAESLMTFRTAAKAAGLRPGSPVIDLTGQAPGLVFVVDGRAVNSAWGLGGYPGSEGLLRESLDRLPCSAVVASWVLDQPGGFRSTSGGFFQWVGASAGDYAVVLTVAAPPGEAGSPEQPPIRLLRDRRAPEAAAVACQAARDAR